MDFNVRQSSRAKHSGNLLVDRIEALQVLERRVGVNDIERPIAETEPRGRHLPEVHPLFGQSESQNSREPRVVVAIVDHFTGELSQRLGRTRFGRVPKVASWAEAKSPAIANVRVNTGHAASRRMKHQGHGCVRAASQVA